MYTASWCKIGARRVSVRQKNFELRFEAPNSLRKSHATLRSWGCRRVRTAPLSTDPKQYFTIIHPYHPWHGRRPELIERRNCWGQWRVYCIAEDNLTAFVPESWTDAGPKDPFVEQAQGRAIARFVDLLELARITASCVKEITPRV